MVEQIETAADSSECYGKQASADRWRPPSVGHRAICGVKAALHARMHVHVAYKKGKIEEHDLFLLILKKIEILRLDFFF